MLELGLYIDGERVDATSGETFESINPATGGVLARVGQAARGDVERAVGAAQQAFAVWSTMPGAERSRLMYRAARILRERLEEIARWEVLDTGKPITEAAGYDVDNAADTLEFFAGVARSIHGEHVDLGTDFAYTRREPLGVCAGIGAWNYPIQIAAWKSAPALACGNTMIFKPAELTPVTAMLLADVYSEAGIPPGVFNVVQGDHRVGEMLTHHPGVAKVSLTGEVGTGKRVMTAAATTLKEVTLELGGKSPLIIFADTDLDDAVSAALLANFVSQGEVCSNGTRVFVERGIHDELMARLLRRMEKIVIGDPLDPATHVGALISAEHMEKVLGYVALGEEAGARLAVGGRRVTVAGCEGGFFVSPAVFDGCSDDMRIVREEIFGPVMAVLSFDTEGEVVARANDTPYGLAAGVFTRDLARAHRVAAGLEAGNVWINTYNVTPPEVSFGGSKQSGIGRENSLAAVDHYTQRKTVYVGLGGVDSPY